VDTERDSIEECLQEIVARLEELGHLPA